MNRVMDFSIIICTRNRADSLARTLNSFHAVEMRRASKAEILVVDNSSTDDTPSVAKEAKLGNFEVRYLFEGRKGKSYALNAALAQARGRAILFTDDDVVPAKDWLERLGRPLLERECDGAVGRIELAEEVRRPWMTKTHKGGVAFFDGPGDRPLEFLGANMGVHHSVLERVPAFDPEIGPGALGLFEDTLFSWQLAESGFRLRYIPEASVTHYPDSTRLLYGHCLSASRTFGASKAYVLHHWRHENVSFPRLRNCYYTIKLGLHRFLKAPRPLDAEGIDPWEMTCVAEIEKNQQFLIERGRLRNYSKRGLQKLVTTSTA
jgi:glucosyl-dolichyl phosphate glucuronosyltransferase